jgi:hypothetical protein
MLPDVAAPVTPPIGVKLLPLALLVAVDGDVMLLPLLFAVLPCVDEIAPTVLLPPLLPPPLPALPLEPDPPIGTAAFTDTPVPVEASPPMFRLPDALPPPARPAARPASPPVWLGVAVEARLFGVLLDEAPVPPELPPVLEPPLPPLCAPTPPAPPPPPAPPAPPAPELPVVDVLVGVAVLALGEVLVCAPVDPPVFAPVVAAPPVFAPDVVAPPVAAPVVAVDVNAPLVAAPPVPAPVVATREAAPPVNVGLAVKPLLSGLLIDSVFTAPATAPLLVLVNDIAP